MTILASLVAIVAAAGIAACALYLLAYFAVDFAFLVQAWREGRRMAERPWRR